MTDNELTLLLLHMHDHIFYDEKFSLIDRSDACLLVRKILYKNLEEKIKREEDETRKRKARFG